MQRSGSGTFSARQTDEPSNECVLPVVAGKFHGYDKRAILEAAGMKFLDVVEGDPKSRYVILPEGWKKVESNPLFGSYNLVDGGGHIRATTYDHKLSGTRIAGVLLKCRFDTSPDSVRLLCQQEAVANVTDGDEVIYTTKPISVRAGDDEESLMIRAIDDAIDWLDKYYPDWLNPSAYWD